MQFIIGVRFRVCESLKLSKIAFHSTSFCLVSLLEVPQKAAYPRFDTIVSPILGSIDKRVVVNLLDGKCANDLAQLAFMTSKLSKITIDPSASIPQKS